MSLMKEILFDVITEDQTTPITIERKQKNREAKTIINLSFEN